MKVFCIVSPLQHAPRNGDTRNRDISYFRETEVLQWLTQKKVYLGLYLEIWVKFKY